MRHGWLTLLSVGMPSVVHSQECSCTPSMEVEMLLPECSCWVPKEPPLPGHMPGITKPDLVLAQDIDYSPYAYLAEPPEGDLVVAGLAVEMLKGMRGLCGIDVVVAQTKWSECWDG